MSFKKDWEFSQACIPLQNKIYRDLLPILEINRFAFEEQNILDIKYHIDVELVLTNGIKLLGQEKALRKRFSGFNTFTIEFYQNRYTKEQGEFFNIGAQFYFHGYADTDEADTVSKLEKWYFIKLFDFLEHLKNTPVKELEKQTRSTNLNSNASFYYINYDKIPEEFIYFSYKNLI